MRSNSLAKYARRWYIIFYSNAILQCLFSLVIFMYICRLDVLCESRYIVQRYINENIGVFAPIVPLPWVHIGSILKRCGGTLPAVQSLIWISDRTTYIFSRANTSISVAFIFYRFIRTWTMLLKSMPEHCIYFSFCFNWTLIDRVSGNH